MNGPNDLGWNSGLDGGVSPERVTAIKVSPGWLAGWLVSSRRVKIHEGKDAS